MKNRKRIAAFGMAMVLAQVCWQHAAETARVQEVTHQKERLPRTAVKR